MVGILLLFLFLESVSVHAEARTTTQTAATYKYSEKFLNNPVVQSYVEGITWKLVDVAKHQSASVSRPKVLVGSTSAIQAVSGRKPQYIGITRGMLNVVVNEAELACVISHEIGHHVLHNQSAVAGLKPIERANARRNQEQEADEYGTILCSDAGYDPFSLVNFLDRLTRLTASQGKASVPAIYQTHSDFADRATYLRQFLDKKRLLPLPDRHFSGRYVAALKSIRNYRSHDAVNELVPDVRASLISIRKKLQPYQNNEKPIPLDQFLGIMSELSQITRQSGANQFLPKTVGSVGGPPLFMKEVVSQDAPLWDDDSTEREVQDILATLARMGVGFIPVIGDAVDLYELLAGVEFGTGRKLDFSDRVMTAVGLLAGSGKMWRETYSGIDGTLDSAKLVDRVGRGSVGESKNALNRAERIVKFSSGSKGGKTVLGRYPRYIELADEIGARKFDIPMNVWNKMTATEKWAANQKFLDRLIKRGDEIILAVPVNNVSDLTGYFRQELDYLIQKGYRLDAAGTRLIKP